jgi:hypothetical protein
MSRLRERKYLEEAIVSPKEGAALLVKAAEEMEFAIKKFSQAVRQSGDKKAQNALKMLYGMRNGEMKPTIRHIDKVFGTGKYW